MAVSNMQIGNNAFFPPFPGLDAVEWTKVFRSMGTASSREGIGAGILPKAGGIEFQNYTAPRYVMVIILRGRGSFTDDRGRKYPLTSGSYFQRQPGIPHANVVEPDSGYVEAYLEIGPLFYQALRAMRIIRREPSRSERRPNRMEQGTATTCVTSSARIMLVVSRFNFCP